MKINKFTLILSLLFLTFFTFHNITSTLAEGHNTNKIEYELDERKVKISMDESLLASAHHFTTRFFINSTEHSYKDIIYIFKISDKPFKPPIS